MNAGVFLFLVLLPFATSLLGAVLGLLDRSDAAATLRRMAWRGLPFLAAGWLFGRMAVLPVLAALGTALVLHLAVGTGIRVLMRRGSLTGACTPWWRE